MGHAIRDRIALELTRLGAQKRQYLVAIAVAESSATLRKHIRTVQRLDDEIAARKEVLRGLPPAAAEPDDYWDEPGFVPYADAEPESYGKGNELPAYTDADVEPEPERVDEIELLSQEIVFVPEDLSQTTIFMMSAG